MRVLFIGDIYGKPGRRAIAEKVPVLRELHKLDVVVANCENAASGKGITPKLAGTLIESGVDVLTGGNHIWQYREIIPFLEESTRLIRPANYPDAPGVGVTTFSASNGEVLAVLQVEGRVFMRNLECPFRTVDRILEDLGEVNGILVDVHAEATAEKQALGWYLAGRVSAVLGTHTHVPTADERILPGGTAFMTDVGMTGPYDSVIGMKVESAIDGFLTQRRGRHLVASGNPWLCGAVVDIDPLTGKALSILRIKEVIDG